MVKSDCVQLAVFSGLAGLDVEVVNALCTSLPDVDRLRAGELKNQGRRNQFVVGRALLQRALREFYGLPLCLSVQPSGKPVAEGASVSITHSGDMVAVALINNQLNALGLDIEQYKSRNFMRLARHYFSPLEVAALEALSKDPSEQRRYFYRLWVLIESRAKCGGEGLNSGLLASVFEPCFLGGGADVKLRSGYVHGDGWALALTAAQLHGVDFHRAELAGSGLIMRPWQQDFEFWRRAETCLESG